MQFQGNNSAYSAATLFQTLGFLLGFASSIYMCTGTKALVYFGITFISFISYCTLEIRNSYKEQKKLTYKHEDVDEKHGEVLNEKTSFIQQESKEIH